MQFVQAGIEIGAVLQGSGTIGQQFSYVAQQPDVAVAEAGRADTKYNKAANQSSVNRQRQRGDCAVAAPERLVAPWLQSRVRDRQRKGTVPAGQRQPIDQSAALPGTGPGVPSRPKACRPFAGPRNRPAQPRILGIAQRDPSDGVATFPGDQRADRLHQR